MYPTDGPCDGVAPAGQGSQLLAGEDGMVSLASVAASLLFLILASLVFNIGAVVIGKIEVQNAADADAYSGGVWLARGLNAVTATNHLMGEMMALVVLHEAVGGPSLASGAIHPTPELDAALTDAHAKAEAAGVVTFAYPDVGKPIRADATVLDGKSELKKALTGDYQLRAAGGLLEKIPPTAAIGTAIDAAGSVIERVILGEWQALSALEDVARDLLPLRDFLYDTLLPAAGQFQQDARRDVPRQAAQVARAIARRNGTSGALFPDEPELPLDDDLGGNPDGGSLPTSQVVRATFPWMAYGRKPILDALTPLKFSKARKFYFKHSNEYCLSKPQDWYRKHGLYLPVLKQMTGDNKGSESWVDDSRLADRLFCIVGLAHRRAPSPAAATVFPQPNPGGLVCYAQAMVYNANPENPGVGPPKSQPEVGWDTLNWASPVTGSSAFEYNDSDELMDATCPRIKVNWQVKLVPTTRLDEAAGQVREPFAGPLGRVVPVPDVFKTH